MNWKTEATEKLRRYDAMCAANRNIPEELSRLEADACSIRSARTDATPVKGGGNRREEALLNNIVHRQELQNRLKYTRQWLRTTNRALNALLPEEKLILSKLYIRPEWARWNSFAASWKWKNPISTASGIWHCTILPLPFMELQKAEKSAPLGALFMSLHRWRCTSENPRGTAWRR